MRLLLLLALLCARPALADSPAPAAQDAAADHFALGVAFYRSGNYAAARVEFEAAYQLSQRPDLLHNLSLAAEKAGQIADAIAYEERFLAAQRSDLAPNEVDEARGRLLRLRETPRSGQPQALPTLPPLATPTSPSKPAKATWRPPGPALGLLAGGTAALAVGVSCGAAALAASSQIRSGQPFTLRELDGLNSRGEALNATAITFDVVAGLALAAGSAWMIADRLRPKSDRRLALAASGQPSDRAQGP